jgi:Xaa-Pro aminopeptidase
MNESRSLSSAMAEAPSPPFDSARLDALLDEAGMDAAVISSKHNIQYLFGGYRFFFFDHFDAIGVSRYLPLLVYVKGRPDESTYIGHAMESYEKDLGKFWPRLSKPRERPSIPRSSRLIISQSSARR